MKKVVTIQDISCFGKCSLTVALPIISAMGIETAVIPTAVLSTHTGGFTGYTFHDLSGDIKDISKHWQSLGLTFDAIYTGYLGSVDQVQIVSDFFDSFSSDDNFIVVDPVLGDSGHLYAGFTEEFVGEMRKLCEKADYILPNMTEASVMKTAQKRFFEVLQNWAAKFRFLRESVQAVFMALQRMIRKAMNFMFHSESISNVSFTVREIFLQAYLQALLPSEKIFSRLLICR